MLVRDAVLRNRLNWSSVENANEGHQGDKRGSSGGVNLANPPHRSFGCTASIFSILDMVWVGCTASQWQRTGQTIDRTV
jgi:hypothetical protein